MIRLITTVSICLLLASPAVAAPCGTGSSGTFAYVHEAEGAVLTPSLVSIIRNGDHVRIMLDDVQLGAISLEGPCEAFEAIDSCIRYRS